MELHALLQVEQFTIRRSKNLHNGLASVFFLHLWYEHSIANMCTFAILLVLNHPDTITFNGVIHNLVPVTLSNMIGGSLLMGVLLSLREPI